MANAFPLSDLARRLPDEVWSTFEPLLPPVPWKGVGRPPADDRACLHGVLYVLVSGVGWDFVPACFPCGKTLKGRLKRWLALDCFRAAWAALAGDYERLRGVNWDKVLLDGAKHKAPKGGRGPGRAPSTAASAGRPSTWPPTSTRCRSGPS